MVQIEFGGQTRTLKFGLKEIAQLEQRLGVDGLSHIGTKLMSLSVTATVAALAIGLSADDPSVTPNLVFTRLDAYLKQGGSMGDLCNSIWRAIEETGLFNDANKSEGSEGNGKAA